MNSIPKVNFISELYSKVNFIPKAEETNAKKQPLPPNPQDTIRRAICHRNERHLTSKPNPDDDDESEASDDRTIFSIQGHFSNEPRASPSQERPFYQ